MNKSSQSYDGIKSIGNSKVKVEDQIITEEALQIYINSKPFTVTMRTPGDDEELIRGLLFTEGIYTGNDPLKCKMLEYHNRDIPSLVNVTLDPKDIGHSYYDSRSMMSVSSCGICGKREWAESLLEMKPLERKDQLSSALFPNLFLKMKKQQSIFQVTGGCHAATCFDQNGKMLAIKEDIGRHNAVDKAIGVLLNNGILTEAKIMLVSGRISYEIVSKTYKAAIPYLAAVSSPSSLSIKVAEEMGMTLLAFCRENSLTCYTHPEGILFPEEEV